MPLPLQAQFWNNVSLILPAICEAVRPWGKDRSGTGHLKGRVRTAARDLEAEVGGLTTCELPNDIATLGLNTKDPF